MIIIGDSGVGKSALLTQYTRGTFNEVNVEFAIHHIEIDNRRIRLQLWDTAGQERFHPITKSFYKETDCCFIAYDATNRESFNNLDIWMNEIKTMIKNQVTNDCSLIILGNKCDLSEKVVKSSEALEFAQRNGNIPFFEVSAKTGLNVQKAFEKVVRDALDRKNKLNIPEKTIKRRLFEKKQRKWNLYQNQRQKIQEKKKMKENLMKEIKSHQ